MRFPFLSREQPPPSVVVVTGAGAGIGRATARAFADAGADVGLIGRDHARLESVRREVEDRGRRGSIYAADVADAAAIDRAADHFERELGPIDVWVNNAMTSVFSPVMETPPDEFRRVTEVTYLGYVHGTVAALRRMLPRDRGVIVDVGSALAYRGIPLQAAYCASKHAVQGFQESLRVELMHDGSNVWITMVQLPAVNTPQFEWVKSRLPRKAQPVPPIYQPEVAARAIVWASRQRRREVIVGGSALQAIVGNRIAPGLVDRYLASTGYDSQQYDGAEDPGRPSNLWDPVPGAFAAHGAFGNRARDRSKLLWFDMHRDRIAAAAAGVAVTAGAALFAMKSMLEKED